MDKLKVWSTKIQYFPNSSQNIYFKYANGEKIIIIHRNIYINMDFDFDEKINIKKKNLN